MKTILQIVLFVAIFGLSYAIYESIMQPIRFQEKQAIRSTAVIERLKNIRDVQVAYRNINNRYTGSFDTLIDFVKNAKLPLIKMEGSLSDSLIEAGVTEAKALAMGLIKRDTVYINAKDSLMKKGLNPDSLQYVPFTDKAKFEMGSGELTTGSGVKVQVFEAKVSNNVYLNGLDEQEIINLNDKANKLARYAGIKVGSLEEANNNAGNWE
jgi:hypothetical protein